MSNSYLGDWKRNRALAISLIANLHAGQKKELEVAKHTSDVEAQLQELYPNYQASPLGTRVLVIVDKEVEGRSIKIGDRAVSVFLGKYWEIITQLNETSQALNGQSVEEVEGPQQKSTEAERESIFNASAQIFGRPNFDLESNIWTSPRSYMIG